MSQSNVQPSSLRRNFSWTFVGNVVYAACQWGILVVLAKLGTPETVGQYTLGVAITTPVILLTNLQLRAIQATDSKQQYSFEDCLGLRLLTTGLALLIISMLVIFGDYQSETRVVILIIGVTKAIESISDVFYGLCQKHERMERVAISMMLKGILSLLGLGSGIFFARNLIWATSLTALAWIILLVTYDIPSCKFVEGNSTVIQIKPQWNYKQLIKLTSVALPLGFTMMLLSLHNNVPRYFIEHYIGQRELGIFAAIASLQTIGTTIVSALGQSASPRLAKYYFAGNNAAFRQLILKLTVFAGGLGGIGILISILAGRFILTLLYKSEYSEHPVVLTLIMLSAGIFYVTSIFGYAVTAKQQIRWQPVVLLLTAVISVCFSYWLIPIYGLVGAAFVLLASSATTMLGYSILLFAKT